MNKDFDIDEFVHILGSDYHVQRKVQDFQDILKSYDEHFKRTLNGEYGKTPEYICTYIYLVDLLYYYDRAIRTNDLELYKYASFEMNSLFFAFNHQNYARWLCRFNDNLQKIDSTHPVNQLKNGAFSVRRTQKNFTRSPIDLTLEQTINANAGNRLMGILAFTNNINAWQKWATTHSIRTFFIHQFYEFVGLIKLEDLSENTDENRVFAEKVNKFIDTVNQSINSFQENLNPDHLFNVSTGKAASEETCTFLLNAISIGKDGLNSFIEECKLSPKRFEEPIRRQKVSTFASELCKPKKSTKFHEKISEAKLERDVIRSMLCMAIKKQIDIEMFLSHPLTYVSHMLAHTDETIYLPKNNNEMQLLLSQKIDANVPNIQLNYNLEIINGDELLKSIENAPRQYGHLATFIRVLESIPIVNYDMDLDSRLYGDNADTFNISGPNQERTLPWAKCVLNQNFRNELVQFCMNYWSAEDGISAAMINDKRVFVAHGQECYLFSNAYEKKKLIPSLQNNHSIFEF